MANKEEKREKGFKDVDVLLIGWTKEEVIVYCKINRLIPNEYYGSTIELLDSKRKTPVLIKEMEYSGLEREYFIFKIGAKRDVIGEIEETTKYFIERERQYVHDTNIRRKDQKGYAGGYTGGFVPYGYYLKDKKLYIDEYESFIVKFMFG